MAKDPKTEPSLPEEATVAVATPSTGIPHSYILLGMILLILLNTIVLALLLPSRETASNNLNDVINRQIEDPTTFKLPSLPPDPPKPVETITMPFGKPEGEKYRIQDVNRNDPSVTSGFSCSVYVKIKKSDETAFNKIYEPKAKEINQLVQTILRESDLTERTEASLSVIRGRIKRRATEELDIPYILEIIINDAQTESM